MELETDVGALSPMECSRREPAQQAGKTAAGRHEVGPPPGGSTAEPAGAAASEGASSDALLHGLAGAIASALSMLLLYPLDQVRVIQQVRGEGNATLPSYPRVPGHTVSMLVHVLRAEGWSGLYRGVLGTLQTLGVSYFVYFFLYNRFKAMLAQVELGWGRRGRLRHSALGDMCASTLGGVLNVLLTCPLWVAATRLKFAQPDVGGSPALGLWRQLALIANREGAAALWRGTGSSLVLVANPILQFTVYGALRRARLRLPGAAATLSPAEALLIGGAAKGVATVATYPLQVAQTLQRAARAAGGVAAEAQAGGAEGAGASAASAGACALLARLVQERGPGALFAGLEAKLLQTVLNAALMFMFYERILAVFLRLGMLTAWRAKLA